MVTRSNSERRVVRIWLVIGALAILAIALPPIVGMNMMGSGYALQFVSFFGLIVAVIVVIVYSQRARRLERILSGERLLAHWQYGGEEWRRYAEAEYRTQRGEMLGLLVVVDGMMVVIGLFFALVGGEAGRAVFLGLLGFAILLALGVWLLPYLRYRRDASGTGEAYISPLGIYLNGSLHIWDALTARLESVEVVSSGAPGMTSILAVAYSFLTRAGRQTTTVRIPVPAGREHEAHEVAAALGAHTVV